MNFSRKLKKIRQERELSQNDLGIMLGVARSTISSWETGNKIPSIERIREIADILQIDPNEFIADQENENVINEDPKTENSLGQDWKEDEENNMTEIPYIQDDMEEIPASNSRYYVLASVLSIHFIHALFTAIINPLHLLTLRWILICLLDILILLIAYCNLKERMAIPVSITVFLESLVYLILLIHADFHLVWIIVVILLLLPVSLYYKNRQKYAEVFCLLVILSVGFISLHQPGYNFDSDGIRIYHMILEGLILSVTLLTVFLKD